MYSALHSSSARASLGAGAHHEQRLDRGQLRPCNERDRLGRRLFGGGRADSFVGQTLAVGRRPAGAIDGVRPDARARDDADIGERPRGAVRGPEKTEQLARGQLHVGRRVEHGLKDRFEDPRVRHAVQVDGGRRDRRRRADPSAVRRTNHQDREQRCRDQQEIERLGSRHPPADARRVALHRGRVGHSHRAARSFSAASSASRPSSASMVPCTRLSTVAMPGNAGTLSYCASASR